MEKAAASTNSATIVAGKEKTIKRKHSKKNIWIFCKNLQLNIMRNIYLNGLMNNITPSGFHYWTNNLSYNNISPSGLQTKTPKV